MQSQLLGGEAGMFSGALNIVFFFSRGKHNNKELEEKEAYTDSLLCRFVMDGLGKKIGESVAVDEDILIIKAGKRYYIERRTKEGEFVCPICCKACLPELEKLIKVFKKRFA